MGKYLQNSRRSMLSPHMQEPLWLPTRLLMTEMNSKTAWRAGLFGIRRSFRPSEFSWMHAKVFPDTWPTESHPTIAFIREMVGGTASLDTSLFQSVAAGKVISRPIGVSGERGKVKIRGKDEFLQYATRVSNLIELVRKQGIQPISSRADVDPNIASGREGDIGIAVVDEKVFFYRKGHHRLGAALALGIERIPCQIYFLSSGDRKIDNVDEMKDRIISALRAIT